jgi:hypothetical protein
MARNARKLLTLGLLGGGGFSPLSFGGQLLAWWDANDASTLFQADNGTTPAVADNDAVGYWGDKSGAGRNAIQATAGSKPSLQTAEQNGKNVVRFVLDFLAASLPATSQPFTVFLVGKSTATYTVITGGVVSSATSWFYTVNNVSKMLSVSAGGIVSSGIVTDNTWFVANFTASGASSIVQVNGNSPSTVNAGPNTLDNVGLGGYYGGTGVSESDIAELVIVGGAITGAQRAQMHAYLNAKWGVF